jgi:hypothetical protein
MQLASDDSFQQDLKSEGAQKAIAHWTGTHRLSAQEADGNISMNDLTIKVFFSYLLTYFFTHLLIFFLFLPTVLLVVKIELFDEDNYVFKTHINPCLGKLR